ncbi:hypothetical protein A2U01_0059530, partial [Trifolium medium]|nr:hypothetical protein [Trifolium medium]
NREVSSLKMLYQANAILEFHCNLDSQRTLGGPGAPVFQFSCCM